MAGAEIQTKEAPPGCCPPPAGLTLPAGMSTLGLALHSVWRLALWQVVPGLQSVSETPEESVKMQILATFSTLDSDESVWGTAGICIIK